MPFTNYFYDRFVSKGFGSLEKQTLPSFVDEPPPAFSVQQFVLNSVFCTPFEEKARSRSFNLIRRTLNAIEEYELARASYETIFPNKTLRAYLKALHHFESCIAELYLAYELFFGLIGERKFPDKGTTEIGELLYRLDRIYNSAKHTEQMLVRAQHFEEGDTLAVWISNDGLDSKHHKIGFKELHDLLSGITDAAAVLANGGQKPVAEPARNSA